jgi:hypothetical protein
MNRVPGKSRLIATAAHTLLWLTCLLLSSQAMALPEGDFAPSYYPGPPNPWSLQPRQPAPVQPPAVQAKPAPSPPAPARSNSWQREFSVYYGRRWPPTSAAPAPAYPQAMPARTLASAPTLETRVESTNAYVYQNLVVAIDVISTVNISSASLQVPDSEDVLLRQLGDITAHSRNRQGQNEIVNTMYYLLSPLRSGDIELQPLEVAVTMDNGSGYTSSYDVSAGQPIHLTVTAPDPGVQPWLPLHELELSASLSNDEDIGEGKPLTLTVEQRAVGMTGSQLPSVENQLQAPGHQLYRENTEYTGVITADGKLVGTRSDRFTLVPLQGNAVEIPAIRVDWWNVERQRKETTVLQGRLLNEHPGEGDNASGGILPSISAPGSLVMWLLLLPVAFLLGRFSPWYMPACKRYTRVLWQRLAIMSEPLRRRYDVWKVRLSPQRNMHLLRRKVANTLPQSARLWFCVRNADHEQDIDDWSQVLRFLVERRLQLPAHLPMSKLAEHIIAIHPGSDPDVIRRLLNQLEAALFGAEPIDDFDAWKKAFKQQVRPRLFGGWHRTRWLQAENSLPVLNPVVS